MNANNEIAAIDIMLPDNKIKTVAGNRSLFEISKEVENHYPSAIVAALASDTLLDLTYEANEPMKISFLDITTKEGARIYQRSLTFLFIYAVRELFPEAQTKVEHSMSKGLYCEIVKSPELSELDVSRIENKMRELVKKDITIRKRKAPVKEAIEIFKRDGFDDKAQLYKYWSKDYLTLYSLGNYENSLHGYIVPKTGLMQMFSLRFYQPGLIIRFPDEKNPFAIPHFIPQKKLFDVFRETEQWCKILDFETVGAMNELASKKEGSNVVWVNEALHEKKIAQIADMITSRKDELRIILIAGPSSSGKTTFAQRLGIQLRVNGLHYLPISLDDYFVDRENTPVDETNTPDFEHIEAIDLELFNDHLTQLINGKAVSIPTFNFITGVRENNGEKIQLKDNQVLIIEGIHGLNERLTQSIPRHCKFKVYVSALTALNIDTHTRIHTTDTRLIRRIVRDNQFRGIDALSTIRRWPSVRRGEEQNIFSLQEEADIMFNSALVYELAVLKQYAEPLLKKIPKTEPEYIDAKRLLTFLSCFVPLNSGDVPSNSILREFIGESCLFKS